MKHKLESRLPGEISKTSDDTTLMAENEELRSLLMNVKEESEKVVLKLNSGHRIGKCQFSFQSQRKAMTKECSNYHTIALISHASKVMLKILQAKLQQYVIHELPDVQAGFRKGRGTRDQIANICWIIEKAREFQKIIYFCFIDYAKAFDCVDHNKLEILKEMGIPGHLTCLLRNLYAGQEATVRTRHGTTRLAPNWERRDRKSTRLNSSH